MLYLSLYRSSHYEWLGMQRWCSGKREIVKESRILLVVTSSPLAYKNPRPCLYKYARLGNEISFWSRSSRRSLITRARSFPQSSRRLHYSAIHSAGGIVHLQFCSPSKPCEGGVNRNLLFWINYLEIVRV